MDDKYPKLPFIRKICAHLPEDELRAAEIRFTRYIHICIEAGANLPVDEYLGQSEISLSEVDEHEEAS